MPIKKADFGDDFYWGVSTAAYQIEGAHDCDGKGPSIWDIFSNKRKKIRDGHHGNDACEFYSRFRQDIHLIQQMNIPCYRFSISWSRLFPLGTGVVNQSGINYYNNLIDACLSCGIEPWITLYHWDLPQALEEKGGWTNRDIIQWFLSYVELCIKKFGDRVKRWMILNEPVVFTGAGYFLGVHAPGRKGLSGFLSAVHHAALSQAEAGRLIRSLRQEASIGTTFSYSHIEPFRDLEKDRIAAIKTDAMLNRLFIEPILGLGYPVKDVKILQRIEKVMKDGDESKLKFDLDFAGLQIYTRELVRHAPLIPFIKIKIVKANKRAVPKTQMDWEVFPPSIYHALKRWQRYSNLKEIIVTENGAAFKDQSIDGIVSDPERTAYIQNHLREVLKAKMEGVPVKGYFVWTLMDNFEWAEGYHPKFGLVHVNFETQDRTIKGSGQWYASFLKSESMS